MCAIYRRDYNIWRIESIFNYLNVYDKIMQTNGWNDDEINYKIFGWDFVVISENVGSKAISWIDIILSM